MATLGVFFLLFVVFSAAIASNIEVIREGDVYLAIVGHFHWTNPEKPGACGPVNGEGVQVLETALYASEKLETTRNGRAKIGLIAIDYCSDILQAAVVVTRYLSAAIGPEDGLCPVGDTKIRDALSKVVGLIGAAYDSETIALAMVARIFYVPLVLSRPFHVDVTDHQYLNAQFLSAAPKLGEKAIAICELVKSFGWTYVSVIADEGMASWAMTLAMETCFKKNNICIASHLRMRRKGGPEEAAYIVDDLLTTPSAKGVIVLTGESSMNRLLTAVKARGVQGQLRLISGGNWMGEGLEATGFEDIVNGTISVRTMEVDELMNHFVDLIATKSSTIPWTQEFIADLLNCSRQLVNNPSGRCGVPFSRNLIYVNDAVNALTSGIWALQERVCSMEGGGVCKGMIRGKRPPYLLHSYVKKAVFSDNVSSPPFRFTDAGVGRVSFDVTYFTKNDDGVYGWQSVGAFADEGQGPKLKLEDSFRELSKAFPSSVCSLPCREGETKSYSRGDHCCWVCVKGL